MLPTKLRDVPSAEPNFVMTSLIGLPMVALNRPLQTGVPLAGDKCRSSQ